jgi:hypothetical protein
MKNLLLLACFICCGVSAQQYHPLLDSVQNRWHQQNEADDKALETD